MFRFTTWTSWPISKNQKENFKYTQYWGSISGCCSFNVVLPKTRKKLQPQHKFWSFAVGWPWSHAGQFLIRYLQESPQILSSWPIVTLDRVKAIHNWGRLMESYKSTSRTTFTNCDASLIYIHLQPGTKCRFFSTSPYISFCCNRDYVYRLSELELENDVVVRLWLIRFSVLDATERIAGSVI